MKTPFKNTIKVFCLSLIFFSSPHFLKSQDKEIIIEKKCDVIFFEDTKNSTQLIIPHASFIHCSNCDTIARVIIGRRCFELIEDPSSGRVKSKITYYQRKYFRGHWTGFDFGWNNYSSGIFGGALPSEANFMSLNTGSSFMVGLNLWQYDIGLQQNNNNFGLITGIGITWNNYRFDSQYILTKDDNGYVSYYLETEKNISKNKLTTSFLTIPLLMEYQFSLPQSSHRIFINGGLYGGFRMGTHTKIVYSGSSGKGKEKNRGDLNLNSFKYGVSIRAGYRFVKLFGNFDLSPLFQKNQGPELYPWSVGLTLLSL